MAKLPSEISADISSLTAEGLGVADVEGKSLRIRNALPGETVQARILRRRKGKLFADGIGVESAVSRDRRAPACQYFPRCGGCSMHHMTYPAQLALKQQQLEQALRQHNVVAAHWAEPVSTGRLGYRRKARLGVRMVGEQVLVGFRESFSNRVARLDGCVALTPKLSALISPLKELLTRLSISHRIPQIEFAQGDSGCALLVRHLDDLSGEDMRLWREFEGVHGVQVLLQSGGYDTLVGLRGEPPQPLSYQLEDWGVLMKFMPEQFTQVNLAMNKSLIRHALAYLGGGRLGDLKGKRVLDLFCGIGNFTLPLARAGASVTGVEAAADAVAMAELNARDNGLAEHTRFRVEDLYLDQTQGADTSPTTLLADTDALLLDPPRSGAGPHLPLWLAGFGGAEIVYVSCNPASFAADAVHILAAGFELVRVGIFDMFPHTTHVETMGYFRRESEPAHG